MSRAGRALAAALLLALAVAAPASAATPTFEQPTATSTFGEEIVFSQAFDSPVDLARVELLLEYPGAIGPVVVQVAGLTLAGRREQVHRLSLAAGGHLFPNTSITARWRLVPADRSVAPAVGPPVTVLYADTRFAWKTLEGSLVRLHWYEGSAAFGRRALEIGENGVRDAATFLGVTERDLVDFYVYADEPAFYDALGPDTRENVVGTAVASIRTMFALIAPSDVGGSEVRRVIPHELTHLVFDTAVRNPYHSPPRWLDEGVAVYLSVGFDAGDRATVEAAVGEGRLMPLTALGGEFPTSWERADLAYAESVSAVDYLVREKGTAALVRLIRGYAGGVTDDEAFTAATGVDVAAFEAGWLADLGAEPPTRYGPQPAPAGKLPPGWEEGSSQGSPAASPVPAGSPAGSPTPAGSPAASPAPASSPGSSPVVLVVAALGGLVVGGALAYVRRRRSGHDTGRAGDAGGADAAGGAGPVDGGAP